MRVVGLTTLHSWLRRGLELEQQIVSILQQVLHILAQRCDGWNTITVRHSMLSVCRTSTNFFLWRCFPPPRMYTQAAVPRQKRHILPRERRRASRFFSNQNSPASCCAPVSPHSALTHGHAVRLAQKAQCGNARGHVCTSCEHRAFRTRSGEHCASGMAAARCASMWGVVSTVHWKGEVCEHCAWGEGMGPTARREWKLRALSVGKGQGSAWRGGSGLSITAQGGGPWSNAPKSREDIMWFGALWCSVLWYGVV